jgi:hypothetical protein
MKNKIITFMIVVSLMSIAMGCSNNKHTTVSYLKILDKSMEERSFWIRVKDPNNLETDEFMIKIDSENVWNLIEKDKVYLVSYEYKTLKSKVKMNSIKIPDSGSAIE